MRRIISLIDMDCFYAQVEQRDRPELWGQPVIVVQHSRQGVEGGILAVSYEARPFGVKRGMSVADAKLKCPKIAVCHVPIGEYADKADIQKYRDASSEVFRVLNNFDSSVIIEKASVDEAFLDLTIYTNQKLVELRNDSKIEEFLEKCMENLPSTYLANGEDVKENDHLRETYIAEFIRQAHYDEEKVLILIAACTVEEIRQRIRDETQFFCSAGVGNNKMMAKLVCARHKPRKQTLIPWKYVKEILRTTPIGDVRGFGGKMGMKIQELLDITLMGEILEVEVFRLIEAFPDQHEYLRAVAEGHCEEPVRPRKESSSIAVSKNFPGRSALRKISEMKKWLEGLTKELAKRLATDQAENKRTAENLVYSVLTEEGKPQKTIKITSYHPDQLFEQIWNAVKSLNKSTVASKNEDGPWTPPVQNISLSATRFQPGIPAQNRAITEWLAARDRKIKARAEAVYVEGDGEDVIFVEETEKPPEPSTSSKLPTTIEEGGVEFIVLSDDNDDKEDDNEPVLFAERVPQLDFIMVDGKRISKQALHHLPPDIKKQYEHRIALEEARQLKQSSTAKKPRKRQAALNQDNPQKRNKPLESFFKRKI